MVKKLIKEEIIASQNLSLFEELNADYSALGEQLARRNVDIDAIKSKVSNYGVAIPSWGVGTGGTRFARFPGPGEPRHIFDKMEDCAVVHQLSGATPHVSLHIPWDRVDDPLELKETGDDLGLGFDAMNSNSFQDQPDQKHSYKFGSLSHTQAATRQQAIDHNIECILFGEKLGSKALTVWVGDGSNFPGQSNFANQFERYLESMKQIYKHLPGDWRLFSEHKMYEPAFYSSVVQDWGTNYLIAMELGEQAFCLVDLGHHAPNVNIEMIVSRLIQFGKLGGFHFNDSKYGDDDLDAGSIDPYRLFLVFNELVDAELRKAPGFDPAHMLDQSHNVTDPIESLMMSAMDVQRAYAQALIVDREALAHAQENNDVLVATGILKAAFRTDVEPILGMARAEKGSAIDPLATLRKAEYRKRVAQVRPEIEAGSSGII
ncbi:MAG: L-rhamnose catabolism isomerase [Devosiaceae bacterium]|nr:L-rhamnose catabolism isomerase [Devosiaceae bacterium]